MLSSFADFLFSADGRPLAGRPTAPSWRQALSDCLADGGWCVLVATVAAYVHLALVLGPEIAAGAHGLAPFDLRPGGYGVDEARQFLQALSPEAATLYRGWARLNDTLVPPLLAWTLCLPLRREPWGLAGPAWVYAVLDLLENVAVDALLAAGPTVGEEAVALASFLTQAKFAAVTVAVVVAIQVLHQQARSR